jgi:Ser/Thr protein kinase RdoA (MazF antagonist)
MHRLLAEEPQRRQVMTEFGGPETLLHGDLWPSNALVFEAASQLQVRLIDWDRAGTGPISYDISSFLRRLPHGYRHKALQYYRHCIGNAGWRLPEDEVLNLLFDTAERARFVNRIVWGAIGVLDGAVEWGFDELEGFDGWLDSLGPILSTE